MIHPVYNLKVSSNLSPVEVPHFASASIRSKKHNLNNSFAKNQTVKMPKNKNSFGASVKKTAAQGVANAYNLSKTGLDFTHELFSSILSDIYGIVKEKGAKTINAIDKII